MSNQNGNRVKGPDAINNPATQSTPRPGDYPLGSL